MSACRENIVGRVPAHDAIDALAEDVGRLRRRVAGDDYATHLAERAAFLVEVLDALAHPTAGELCAAGIRWGADEQEAVEAALEDVDRRAAALARLVGSRPIDYLAAEATT